MPMRSCGRRCRTTDWSMYANTSLSMLRAQPCGASCRSRNRNAKNQKPKANEKPASPVAVPSRGLEPRATPLGFDARFRQGNAVRAEAAFDQHARTIGARVGQRAGARAVFPPADEDRREQSFEVAADAGFRKVDIGRRGRVGQQVEQRRVIRPAPVYFSTLQ